MVDTTPPPPPTATSTTGTAYIGNVPHARILDESQVPTPAGVLPLRTGYKKGDQFSLLPTNGQDLITLQQALVQAGYLDKNSVIYGSPDQKTVKAFEQLLTTANLSGSSWQSALSARLAAASQQAPQGTKTPPLTIALSNPEDIKKVANSTAKTLLGNELPEADLNNFVASYQAQERAAQTAAYYQQYSPGQGYGPGGETTAAPSEEAAAADYVKSTNPAGYQAYGIGSQVMSALNSLRTSGNLPNA